jgi:hypothetical protein
VGHGVPCTKFEFYLLLVPKIMLADLTKYGGRNGITNSIRIFEYQYILFQFFHSHLKKAMPS